MATKVGLLHLDVAIHDAMTLKDKRRVVKGFKDRIAHGRNVSVAEVDYLDRTRRALLAVAMVGNDFAFSDGRWTCGKGQRVPVGVGLPTIKISEITVGGSDMNG